MSVFKRKFRVEKQVVNPDAPGHKGLVVLVSALLVIGLVLVIYDWRNIFAAIVFSVFGWGLCILRLRHRRTFSGIEDDIQPMQAENEKLILGKQVVAQGVVPTGFSDETLAGHREIVRQWQRIKLDNPKLAKEFIFPQLNVDKSTFYLALQNWRLGYLDDRAWWRQTWDRFTGHWYDDDTRYV